MAHLTRQTDSSIGAHNRIAETATYQAMIIISNKQKDETKWSYEIEEKVRRDGYKAVSNVRLLLEAS